MFFFGIRELVQRLFFAFSKTGSVNNKSGERAAPFVVSYNKKRGLVAFASSKNTPFRLSVSLCVGWKNGQSHSFFPDLFVSPERSRRIPSNGKRKNEI